MGNHKLPEFKYSLHIVVPFKFMDNDMIKKLSFLVESRLREGNNQTFSWMSKKKKSIPKEQMHVLTDLNPCLNNVGGIRTYH